MGLNESTPKGPQNSSYYGTSSQDITPENAVETIREMQKQRYEQRRGKFEQNPKFKVLVSLTNYEIKDLDGVLVFGFNLKADASGKMVLIANGRMVSCTFSRSEEKIKICFPLPEKSDFDLEVTTTLDDYEGEILPTVAIIRKQLFKFKLIDASDLLKVQFISQNLLTRSKTIKIDKSDQFDVQKEPRNSRCLFCLENEAQKGNCQDKEHKIMCDLCEATRNIKINTCPICDIIKAPVTEQVDDLIY